MAETTHQKALIRWFDVNYPGLSPLLFSIPNGANFSGASPAKRFGQINKLKAEGMRSGVPDLFLAFPFNGFAGLFIEMKDEGKTLCSLSKEQAYYLDALNEVGFCTVWCSGFEIAKAAIETYLNGLTKPTLQ